MSWLMKLLSKESVVANVINSATTLISDKTLDAGDSNVKEKFKNGVSVSMKRVMNIGGAGGAIVVALGMMSADGPNKMNIIILGMGMGYSALMSFISVWEKKK